MKKSKRFLCMLIAAVMLLGAFPAHAASAPPAVTYKAASPTRLPDGTTGAKVGMTGAAQLVPEKARVENPADGTWGPYGTDSMIWKASLIHDRYAFNQSCLEAESAKTNPTVYLWYDPADTCLADFAGAKLPAGYLYDVHDRAGNFVCQYDTRGETQDFVIPCAPGDDPANPKPKTVPVVRTQFNDIKPGSRYYDAVTTLAKNKVIYTVFDEDPNGNFKPSARLTENEIRQIVKRLRGVATENYTWTRGEPQKLYCKAQYWRDLKDPKWHVECNHKGISVEEGWDGRMRITNRIAIMNMLHYAAAVKTTPEQQALTEQRWNADQTIINQMIKDHLARIYDKAPVKSGARGIEGIRTGVTRQQQGEFFKQDLRKVWNGVFTDGATEASLADGSYLFDEITRGEFCLMLYRFGLDSFGCMEGKLIDF